MKCFKKQCVNACCGCISLGAGVCCLLCLYMIPPFVLLFYSMSTTCVCMVASLFYLVVKVSVTTLYFAGLCVKKSVLCIPYLLYFFMSVIISRTLGFFIVLYKQASEDSAKQNTTLYGYTSLFVILLPVDVYFFLCIYSLYLQKKEQEKGR